MYELLVLALLMQWPLHAYLIASIANDMIGPWEKISRGSLSTLLTRLEREELIAQADPAQVPFPTERSTRVYVITEKGRRRFRQLMTDTTSNPGTYQRLFRIKVLHLDFLDFEDQLYLLDHYINYCETGMRYMRGEAQDFITDPMKQENASEHFRFVAPELMEMVAQQWQTEMEWARRVRERICAMHEKGEQEA